MLEPSLPKDWAALGSLHCLQYYDVESLMSCRQIMLSESWHVVILKERLEDAITKRDFETAEMYLCLLIRAEMETDVGCSGLGVVVLQLALRNESAAGLAEAMCVRLARVLAVKLDKLRQINKLSCGGL